jgi:hypothetical protein
MEDLKLELNHTYLLQFGNSDVVSSVTVLVITDKAYYLRWNRGLNGNDTWELKSKMYYSYNIVEDISDYMKSEELKESKTLLCETTWKDCPECQGSGWLPDDQTTGGRKICTCCWGSKKVIDVVKIV